MFAAFFQLLLYILASLGVVKVIEELKKTRLIRQLMRSEVGRKWRRFRGHVLESWWFKKIQGIIKMVFEVRCIQFVAQAFLKDNDYVFIQLPLPPRSRSLTLKMTFHDLINSNFEWIVATSSDGCHLYQLTKEINDDGFALSHCSGPISFQLFKSESLRDSDHFADHSALHVPAIFTSYRNPD
jgi:hypothetical protein